MGEPGAADRSGALVGRRALRCVRRAHSCVAPPPRPLHCTKAQPLHQSSQPSPHGPYATPFRVSSSAAEGSVNGLVR